MYQRRVLQTRVARVLAQFHVALEVDFHLVGEFEGLEEGESDQRDGRVVRVASLLPRSHQFLLEHAAATVRQRDGVVLVTWGW